MTRPDFSKKYFKWLAVVVVLAAIVFLAYGYITTKNDLNRARNPQTAGASEIERLVNEISKTIQLPSGETPILWTVSNASELIDQEFFKNAKDGDKVLIYSKADKALLYRPSTKKIIEYSKVNLSSTQ